MVAQTQKKHNIMNPQQYLIYALHNLGQCKSGNFNSIIREICNTHSREKANIPLLLSINEMVFECGKFSNEYPSLVDNFIKSLQ